MGWIGVDLDGTLAEYHPNETWDGTVGRPIRALVDLIKEYINCGHDVRILTARVASDWGEDAIKEQRKIIEEWCLEHLGAVLPVTAEKNHEMEVLFDDRAVAVRRNEGSTAQWIGFDESILYIKSQKQGETAIFSDYKEDTRFPR